MNYRIEEKDEMIATVKKYIDAIVSSQESDGWICPCKNGKRAKYDTWAIQLICKTLKVYYDCSGDERIPDVIYRVLKNYYEMLKSGEIRLFVYKNLIFCEKYVIINYKKKIGEKLKFGSLHKILYLIMSFSTFM